MADNSQEGFLNYPPQLDQCRILNIHNDGRQKMKNRDRWSVFEQIKRLYAHRVK